MALSADWLISKANAKLNAAGMDKDVANIVRDVIKEMQKQGIYVGVAQGYRSKALQDSLYAKGRTEAGPIVTNAKGGQSNHNFGVAVDLFQFSSDGREAIFESNTSRYLKIVAAMKKRGMKWGGDWSGFRDYPHFELYDAYRGEKKPGATDNPKVNTSSKTYTIVSGDTLSGIAKKYKTTVKNLKSWNNLKSDLIKPKQVLKVSKPTVIAPTVAGSAIVPYPGKPLYKGAPGMLKEDIERIQRAMKVNVTGKYDAVTEKAVEAYQKRKKLAVDGAVGPVTWNVIF